VPYFQFEVQNASGYGGIGIAASYNLQGNWSNSGNWYVLFSADGNNWSQVATAVWNKVSSWQTEAVSATTSSSGNGSVYFRIYAIGAQDGGSSPSTTATMYLDNVRIYGCRRPDLQPALTKSFSPNPIAAGGMSTLTFMLTNPNAVALTGAAFVDNLPAGIQVANPPTLNNTCGGTVSGATAGSTSINLSGGTIPANGSCTIRLNVTATTAGQYSNISGFISTAQTGVNDGPNGAANATLAAMFPPVIEKVFSPDVITANSTSTLVFSITNPNQDNVLDGVAFSDTFPAGMVVANPTNASTSGCGSPTFVPSVGAGAIAFSSGTIAAGGVCTVRVDVTVSTAGDYLNTSSAVTANIAGGMDTASDILRARAANPGLAFSQQVATVPSGHWRNFVAVPVGAEVYYRLVVENIRDVALTTVSVSEPDVDPSHCSWQHGNGNLLSVPFSLPVADADEGHIASCVIGPFVAVAGSHLNTATADSDQTGPLTDVAAYATTDLTLKKTAQEVSFTPAWFGSG